MNVFCGGIWGTDSVAVSGWGQSSVLQFVTRLWAGLLDMADSQYFWGFTSNSIQH